MTLRPLRDLYGASWAKSVDDLSDAFFADYDVGASILRKRIMIRRVNYANASIASVSGGPASEDPSKLPRDVPRYPASGFTAVSISATGEDVAAELATPDDAPAVERWYVAMAPKLGWVKRESLAQAVFGKGSAVMNVTFRKTEGAMTYDFTVTMLKAGTITLYRTPTTPESGFEGFPLSVPVYRGANSSTQKRTPRPPRRSTSC